MCCPLSPLTSHADAYLVAVALDGGDKRSARIQLAAPLSLQELRRCVPEQQNSSGTSTKADPRLADGSAAWLGDSRGAPPACRHSALRGAIA